MAYTTANIVAELKAAAATAGVTVEVDNGRWERRDGKGYLKGIAYAYSIDGVRNGFQGS